MTLIVTKITPKLAEWALLGGRGRYDSSELYKYDFISENGSLIKSLQSGYKEIENEDFLSYVLMKGQNEINRLKDDLLSINKEYNDLKMEYTIIQAKINKITSLAEPMSELTKVLKKYF